MRFPTSTGRTRRHTCLLVAVASLVTLGLPGVAEARRGSVCVGAAAQVDQAAVSKLVRATLCTINSVRARHRLPRLRLNAKLSRAARRHSRDMVRRRYFAHDSVSGASFVDRIRRSGYLRSARSWSVAENLAWGSGNRGTPERIMRAWMNSPGHKGNILTRRYRQIGIGIAVGAPSVSGLPAATYTTDFGIRR